MFISLGRSRAAAQYGRDNFIFKAHRARGIPSYTFFYPFVGAKGRYGVNKGEAPLVARLAVDAIERMRIDAG